MLLNLYIKNYALIDKLNLSFNKGLTIITGETGAGKSILLGGLELIRGKRAQQGLLKEPDKKSIVEATFDLKNYNLKSLFEQDELDYESESIIRRELLPNGKSRAFVNDSPARLDSLIKISNELIDIHSQHQTLELGNTAFQFNLLDAVSDNENLLKSYHTSFKKYQAIQKQLQELSVKLMYAKKELSYKKFQLEELNEYKLDDIDFEQLEQQVKKLDNIELINQVLVEAIQKLDDEERGILHALIALKTDFQKIGKFDTIYQQLAQRLESMQLEVQDLTDEINRLTDRNVLNPSEQANLQNQYAAINKLLLKHQVLTVGELITLRDKLAADVTDLSSLEEQIALSEQEIKKAKSNLSDLAKKIHQNRISAIPKLIKEIEEILKQLSMQNTLLKIELEQTTEFLHNGQDQLKFMISSDKGKSFGELKRIASGGELSRLMLAVKTVLSKYKKLPTIIFDEIDAGISGEVAQNMAEVLKKMSFNMQVIVITHLPQIAVKGDTHFKVYKTDQQDVSTHVKQLNNEERVYEIAEMLEGKPPSDSALQHAKHLLSY